MFKRTHILSIHKAGRILLGAPVLAISIALGSTAAVPAQESSRATIDGKSKVRVGKAAMLRGSFPGAPAGSEVQVYRRFAGQHAARQVAATRTDDRGSWSQRVRPRRSARWSAQLVGPDPALEDAQRTGGGGEGTARRTSGEHKLTVRSITKVRPTSRHVVRGEKVKLKGRVKPRGKRRVVVRLGSERKQVRANRNGRFSAKLTTGSTGSHKVLARAKRNASATSSKDRGGRVIAYRHALASWYGPGFYGRRTACGQTYSSSIRGVAHKTLPCGTRLKLRYRGKTVNVKVIDRGPYSGNREFDLSAATKNDLGFSGTGYVLSSR